MALSRTEIIPHRITKPIQLLAIWFAALVIIDCSFLVAASNIEKPSWITPMLTISAILFVPAFLIAAVVMQTKFRIQLQDDPYYGEWLKRNEKLFLNFQAEDRMITDQVQKTVSAVKPHAETPEERRVMRYQVQRGLFIVHAWRPSKTKGQIADIVIWLHQHREGPLSSGLVDHVEYYLGPMFFKGHHTTKRNLSDSFKLEVSAYGPMLCLARVFIKNEREPIEIERYIDFEEAPSPRS